MSFLRLLARCLPAAPRPLGSVVARAVRRVRFIAGIGDSTVTDRI
jgi:hypothetical protein